MEMASLESITLGCFLSSREKTANKKLWKKQTTQQKRSPVFNWWLH